MTKDSVMRAFYAAQIAQLVERVEDIALLDLIYRLLKNEEEENGNT